MWPFSYFKEKALARRREWDEWQEQWNVGDKIEYLGTQMTIERTWGYFGGEEPTLCLVCAYVDHNGRICREHFYKGDVPYVTRVKGA
jgi:hypothetical protein